MGPHGWNLKNEDDLRKKQKENSDSGTYNEEVDYKFRSNVEEGIKKVKVGAEALDISTVTSLEDAVVEVIEETLKDKCNVE